MSPICLIMGLQYNINTGIYETNNYAEGGIKLYKGYMPQILEILSKKNKIVINKKLNMKKIIICSLVILALFSCSKRSFTVDINMNNYKVFGTAVNSTSVVMENVITLNGGF